jgi:hypothetical protein
MRRHLTSIVAATLLATGCVIGPSMSRNGGSGPAGAQLRVVSERSFVEGELLAVEDTVLLMLVDSTNIPSLRHAGRFARVPLWEIRNAPGVIRIKGPWTAEQRERYRRLSRYPFGVSATLERRLLARYGADSVIRVGR